LHIDFGPIFSPRHFTLRKKILRDPEGRVSGVQKYSGTLDHEKKSRLLGLT